MVDSLIKHIEKKAEIIPDKHDGSYELVRETVKAFEKLDKNKINYKDINLLYFMTVGTFTKVSNFDNKIKRIEESNLEIDSKDHLKSLLGRLMQDSQMGKFSNSIENGTIGMFGSGFSSFSKFEANNNDFANFITMCTKILYEEDEEKNFEEAEQVLKKPIRGLGIAGVSQILHCLKPFVFPILNNGEGMGINIYKKLGVKLINPSNTTKYIQNVRIIKEFRDKHFSFKNYRVIDIAFLDYNKPNHLERPFSDIFKNREEADWAFEFIAEVSEKLMISGTEDPRVAMSLRLGGKTLRFIFCNWLIVSFQSSKDEQNVVIPLLNEKAIGLKEYQWDEFSASPGEASVGLYMFPLQSIKEIDEVLAQLFEETLLEIRHRFKNYNRSPFRSRPSHIPELVEMVFNEDKRYTVFENGLTPTSEEKIIPNIWWVNQKKMEDYLWAPLKNKAGKSVFHWETLAEVNVGDIILHYNQGALNFVSKVVEPVTITKDTDKNGQEQDGRHVKIKLHDLSPPVSLPQFNQQVLKLNIPQGPLDLTGGVKEGYFFRFNEEALKIIQKAQPETNWPEYTIIEDMNPVYTLEQLCQDTFLQQNEVTRFINAIHRKGQAIIYGAPGTGKTFIAEKIAKHLISGGNGFYEIIQFHPAYTYEDFMQGIRPQIRDDNLLEYELVPGRFMNFCHRCEESDDTCVLIIDEINRANLARVFGELMYLLEYRNKNIPLASGKTLHIPDNVRIIGTMNTADRSIALVDFALRRRFAFLPLRPNYEVLKGFQEGRGVDVTGLIEVLRQLNTEIGDPHYEVGHSFFLVENLPDDFQDIWQMEIIPYLEEYFFDQPDKVNPFAWEKIKDKINL